MHLVPLSSALVARAQLDADIALTLSAAHWEWQQVTPWLDDSWVRVGPRMESLVAAGQLRAASRAPATVEQVLAEQNLNPRAGSLVNPSSLVGVASDGRGLESLLYQGVVAAGEALNKGIPPAMALGGGWAFLERAVATQVADAFRVSMSVQTLVTPSATFSVRVVNPGACSRCVVLAGKNSYGLDAFKRHPKCRCINVPTNGTVSEDVGTDPLDYFNGLTEEQQDRTFTRDGARAIRDGADMNQVVNARRGMFTTADGVKVTSEGMTRRGHAHHVMVRNPLWRQRVRGTSRPKLAAQRLMPEQIYKIAGTQDNAIRLLKAYGYI